jgi:methionyl aminopeptidase
MEIVKNMKAGRNDPCPCGSGLKYKRCCLNRDRLDLRSLYLQRYRIRLKEAHDIEGIRRTGRLVLETLDLIGGQIRPGMTTDDIDALAHEFTVKNGAIPAPLNYRGFPKSVCVSVNEVVCHGIPGSRTLQEGDIVNVDVTTILHGYYADAGKTFLVGAVGLEAQRIVRVARESLRAGLAAVRPGNTIGDIGSAIQTYAEGEGCSVVREFTGHGVGFEFHEPPQVPHFGSKGQGIPLVPGMVLTVEPMINLGKRDVVILDDGWTVVTKDRSLSSQFEQTVLVTGNEHESLTPFES